MQKSPTAENAAALKATKTAVQKLKRSLKKSYVETCLNKHASDPKKLWRMMRTFWPNNKGNSNHISSIGNITESEQIANHMNEFFCETVQRIQSNIVTYANLLEFAIFYHLPIFVSFQQYLFSIHSYKITYSEGWKMCNIHI